MKTPKDIETQVEKTLNVLDSIEDVKVSPFFKDKVMQRLFTEKEAPATKRLRWLSPSLQIAAIVCVLLINIVGFVELSKTTYQKDLSEFANMYELSQDQKPSLFN